MSTNATHVPEELRAIAARAVFLLGESEREESIDTGDMLEVLQRIADYTYGKWSRTPRCLECQGDTRAYTDDETGARIHFCNVCGGRQ